MRQFPSAKTQYQSQRLRNELCRLSSPTEMARVSAHLRNYAVAETIGLVGTLDSHPKLAGVPTFAKGPAAFQQTTGTPANPFTHVQPSNLLVGSRSLSDLFGSTKAQDFVARIFGMGVLAPADWSDGKAFAIEPRELNIVDNITERYGKPSGLVGAFVATVQAAAKRGTWNGSGVRQHNLSSLTDYIYEHYKTAWRPNAFEAYYGALGHLSGQLKAAQSSGDEGKVAKVKQRIEILDAQIRVFGSDTPNLREATQSVMTATADENWK